MRVQEVRVRCFRGLTSLDVELDALTAIVGANNCGKSTFLHALRWFFEGFPLATSDYPNDDPQLTPTVTVEFLVENDADRQFMGKYVQGERAYLRRTAGTSGSGLAGRARGNPAFVAVRTHEKAGPAKLAYESLQEPFGLPAWKSLAKAHEALNAWEAEHQDELRDIWEPTSFKGATGTGQLAQRCRFAMVTAGSNPSADAEDSRGTILRQILDRMLTTEDSADFIASLKVLEEDTKARLQGLWAKDKGPAVGTVETALQSRLERYVPGLTLGLRAADGGVKVSDPATAMMIGDGGHESEPGRHGHGLQRALSLALVEELANVGPAPAPDEPSLVLAIEEPELYQHPTRARHLAEVLEQLAKGTVQVVFATHSPLFVKPARFDSIRRLSKTAGGVESLTTCMDDVVAHLAQGTTPQDLRVEMRLNEGLAEAFFARAVVLVEGTTDEGVIHGLLSREGFSLDAHGIALVSCHGKAGVAPAVAVLREIGIPYVVMFDADAKTGERAAASVRSRLQQAGDEPTEERLDKASADAIANEAKLNREILKACGMPPVDFPAGRVSSSVFVMPDHLETLLRDDWPEHVELRRVQAAARGKSFGKSRPAYMTAARDAGGVVPALLRDVANAVRDL